MESKQVVKSEAKCKVAPLMYDLVELYLLAVHSLSLITLILEKVYVQIDGKGIENSTTIGLNNWKPTNT